ncbi:MAG: NUDIX domain-containing protein [Pseudomonadota bacterium]
MSTRPRVSVRGIVMADDRLLLVNAWPGNQSDLLCAPGGGVEPGQSLPENLIREIYEETGLTVEVGPVVLVNEFHDPNSTYHQIDIYFRCEIVAGQLDASWRDVDGVVHDRRFVTREEIETLLVKPDSLAEVAWGGGGITYDPLEPVLR